MLDLWQNNAGVSAKPQPGEANDLPAGFGDSFDAAWHEGQLFSSSIAQGNAQMAGLESYLDEVQQKSGQDIRKQVYPRLDMQTAAQEAVAKIKQNRPDLQIPDLTDDELNSRAVAASSEAHKAFIEMSGREKTFAGKAGSVLGGLASGTVDPVNLVGLAVAPEAELGVVGSAAAWGGFGVGSQAVNELANAPFREQVQPGYAESGQPGMNILEAGAGGAVLGGLFKGMGNVWQRMKTGEWPRSVRDAGNVVEGEANTQASNVLPPGPEGEAAHREAMSKSIDDIVAGRAVQAPDSVSEVPAPPPGGITAYHGSPHDFDQFDLSKTGTGEGMQAYGQGLYFSENKKVAEDYADRLGSSAISNSDLVSGNYNLENRGNVYSVSINADRDHFLDLDKITADQSQHVRDALDKLGIDEDTAGKAYRRLGVKVGPQDINDTLGREKAASAALYDAGIPGIKYLDKGSRGGGKGSHNFVVFNDRDVQITHKNGQPLTLFESNEAKIDSLMDERGAASSATASAKAERATSSELPFEATAKEAKAEQHARMIADGLERMGVPKEDAPTLAARVIAAKSDDEARAILNETQARPNTIAETVPSASDIARGEHAPQDIATTMSPEERAATFAEPAHDTALNTQLEQLRDSGHGGMIPVGVDERGGPQYRLLDEAIQDAANDRDAADQIEACVNPPAEEAAE